MRKKMLLRAGLTVIALAGLATTTPRTAQADSFKVTICHIPPGNPGNAHTIVVGVAAVPAHLAHGDTLGECGPGI